MRNSTIAALVAVGLAAGCGGLSSLNPMNMFGPSEDVEMLTPLEAQQYRRDPRPLMDQITDLVIEPSPGGALVRATGISPTTGYYGGALREVNGGEPVGGILTFQFVAAPPPADRPVAPGRTQQVVVAQFVSDIVLQQTTEILVIAERNARAAKR